MGKFLNTMISGRVNNKNVIEIMFNKQIIWSEIFDKYGLSYSVSNDSNYKLSDYDASTGDYYALPKFTLNNGEVIIPGIDERYSVTVQLKDGRSISDINVNLSDVSRVEIFYTGVVNNISFKNNTKITDLSIGRTDNLTSIDSMFYNCNSLVSLNCPNFTTDNIANMSYMFYNCNSLTSLDLSSFNTSNVTNMYYMFYNCSSLAVLDISNWDTTRVTNSGNMLYGVPDVRWNYIFDAYINVNLTESRTGFSYQFPWTYDLIYTLDERSGLQFDSLVSTITENFTKHAHLPKISSSISSSFYAKYKLLLTDGLMTTDSTTPVENIRYVLVNLDDAKYLDFGYTKIKRILKTNKISGITKIDFRHCDSAVSLNLSNIDVSNVTDMDWVFTDCNSLQSLNLSGWNTSNVTSMSYMFHGCNSLKSLDLSSFDTSKVTNMYGMFYECRALTGLDLSSFNTINVTDMSRMFAYCRALSSVIVSSFNTSSVTNMSSMFYYCSNLKTLNGITNFDTSNVTDMENMFYYCSSLTSLNISGWNTRNVTDMSYMFFNCSRLTTLDLSNFNTFKVTDMSAMFLGCSRLKTLDISNFNTYNVTSSNSIFSGLKCTIYIPYNFYIDISRYTNCEFIRV